MGILERWRVTSDELDEIVSASQSLRGFIFGYVSEYKLRKIWLTDERITGLHKTDNHERAKKGDLTFTYKGLEITVEVKSLQTHSIRRGAAGCQGKFQCDASDRRRISLPSGETIETTCLAVGEFDLLAVNLFEFSGEWQFAFARSKDLPRSRFTKYTPEQRQHILATLIDVTWPLQPPFEPEPFRLLNEIVRDRARGR
ncbi:MAG: restriction endonuclease [Planctomycetes bacterium]|nr:restriction endonuclease [Planctomycetota bacterium]